MHSRLLIFKKYAKMSKKRRFLCKNCKKMHIFVVFLQKKDIDISMFC